ncbi:hypothetical protein SDC9_181335 [bioreactor metagenome]|uniref:Uncharacterized protein n=1 Tax=bioreactor metagenome TaxID=1076179 RepID=A0A645HDI5_9ZZZZ
MTRLFKRFQRTLPFRRVTSTRLNTLVRLEDLALHRMEVLLDLPDPLHISVTAIDKLVRHHPVKPLRPRLQTVNQLQIEPRRKGELVEHLPLFALSQLDPLADLNLLLARQQRHLPHLVQIHPDRVVEKVHPAATPALLLLLMLNTETLNLGGVDDLNLHPAQNRQIRLDVRVLDHRSRQRLIDIVVG